MLSRSQVTCPSMKGTLQPAPWKLYGSSFAPQLLLTQLHHEGPPYGVLLLLIILTPLSLALVTDGPPGTNGFCWLPGGPETPLAVSGSPQRQALRNGGLITSPTGSVYLLVNHTSLRPTSSMTAMVFDRPSMMSPAVGPSFPLMPFGLPAGWGGMPAPPVFRARAPGTRAAGFRITTGLP